MTLLVRMKVNDGKTGDLLTRQDFLYLDVEECDEKKFEKLTKKIERTICGYLHPETFTKDSVTLFEYVRIADKFGNGEEVKQ